jgi:hypothetical protein
MSVTVERNFETARGWIPRPHGGGEHAEELYRKLRELLESSRWHDHSGTIVELNRQFKESRESSEEYPDVAALSTDLYQGACVFLRSLPRAFQPPEISVLDNGEISFDWHREDGGSITVMMLNRTTLIYASLWDDAAGHPHKQSGTLEFATTVPDEIISELRALF